MKTLIVVANPDANSLTHSIATKISEGLTGSGKGGTVEIADLIAQGFSPTFAAADRAAYHQIQPLPADVLAEQARLDGTDQLVLVFPVYWWSMPAVLKGWIDRVFVNGWAFEYSAEGGFVPKLDKLTVQVALVAGGDIGSFERHGYLDAVKKVIGEGIFEYCGCKVENFQFFWESETSDAAAQLVAAQDLGARIAK